MDAATPTTEKPAPALSANFDIVATYRHLLASDPDMTMPVAAIESLVEAIAHSTVSTVAETLDLLDDQTKLLKAAVSNHISLSAGTDLFKRYLTTTFNRPGSSARGGSAVLGASDDFMFVRNTLLSNGRLFVENAKASRERIAHIGRNFIREGKTVLTNGGSRVVAALLRAAAENSAMRFRVIYVLSPNSSPDTNEGDKIVADLRARNVPVATIPDAAVAYSMGKVDMVIVGAEGVVENGGIISRLGTYQMGSLAKQMGKPFYVVVESHKFVRLFPLGQFDLPIKQKVLDFRTDSGSGNDKDGVVDEGVADVGGGSKCSGQNAADAVDFTPPELISAIVTESGVMTPSAVSEELIKIWF